MMGKRSTFDGVVVSELTTDEGYIHTFDKNHRTCWDNTAAARVVLVKDLRRYGKELHIGQLGWTVSGTTDGYQAIDVEFDTGQRLSVRLPFGVTPIERVAPARAKEMSQALIQKCRNTRFDADRAVAEKCRQEWMHQSYGQFISLTEMTVAGEGDQELYAFTFSSLRELAILKGQDQYPVKIGFSKESDAGALGRIRGQITEAAAYPERPILLHVQRTWDGRDLERQVHRNLRELGRKAVHSLGTEWFLTSKPELLAILQRCSPAAYKVSRPVTGTDETLEEGISGLLAQGATVEFGTAPESAGVRMSIKPPERGVEPE
jgi:hypothetical protein